MKKELRHLTGKYIAAISVFLAASVIALTATSCSEKNVTPISETSSVQTSASAPTESSVTTESAGRTITIGEMKELKVPFGRITENVGYYQLGLAVKDAPTYRVKGQYVYCLSGHNGEYQLRKINIEDLERSDVCEIKVDGGSVSFFDLGFKFDLPGETVFYDFSLHEIYRTRTAVNEQILAPYKDGYIIKDGDDIRILHLDEDTPFRKLDSKEYEITGSHSTGEETYLILKNKNEPASDRCSVYDVNRDVYWRQIPDNVKLSDAGMVRFAGGKYIITNFARRKTGTYSSRNPGKAGSSLFDGVKLYFFDEADRKIKYYIPSRQQICVLSEAEFTDGATIRGVYGNYVYVEYAGVIYFIDTAGQKEVAGEAYMKKISTDLAALKKNLEFHYKITILNGKDVIKPASNIATVEAVTSDLENLTATTRLYTALKKFNYRFFDTFKQNKKAGVCIMLCGNMNVMNAKSGVEGFSFTGDDAYYIALDARSADLPTTFCREIMHTVENRMADADRVFGEWNRYNPDGFVYSELSAGAAEAPYVPETESDPANVYFTDSFACASPAEDRARLFAVMFMPETYKRNLSDYPCLMSKAAGLKHVLLTYYPSLSDTAALQNIK